MVKIILGMREIFKLIFYESFNVFQVSNPEWQEEARGNFQRFICENFLQNVLECKEDNI